MENARPSSLASGSFTGFTKLCKGLAVVLVAGYAVQQVLPSAISYLALIPGRTIPFAWNLVTAGYVEQSIVGLIISTIGLLFVGKLLEPIWGPREFLKFIFVVNTLTSICLFITMIVLYYTTTQESYLYHPVSGFQGILSGFLVGVKQIMPDQELSVFVLLKIKAKWLPSLLVLISIVVSFFVEFSTYLPIVIFGTYMSWLYLRYLQRKPETGLKGDPSDEFAFATFFPEILRPIIDPVATIFYCLPCGRSDASNEPNDHIVGLTPLPGSDPVEASRRRERGARALEERLTAEKTATSAKNPDTAQLRGSENV